MTVKLIDESEGTAVLVSIEDLGPFFARAFVEETEPLYLDPEGPFGAGRAVLGGMRSWRVEVPEIPHRLVGQLRGHAERLGRPLTVRLWGAIGRTCYVGKAYGLFNVLQPYDSMRPSTVGMTLHGQGPVDRERDW